MAKSKRKNLLVLLCDQLQRDVLDIYGGPVQTKAWSQLAKDGIVLDRFYCATPLCVPTRPSMMTSKWPHAHGSTSFGKGYSTIRPGQELLIDRLLDDGYQVGHSGIWHINREPEDDRSGEYALFNSINFPYGKHEEMRKEQGLGNLTIKPVVKTPSDNGFKEWSFSIPIPAEWTDPIEEHPDMISARKIADLISSCPDDKPFAAWCSIGAPHPPILCPEPFLSMFKPEDMTPPPGFGEDDESLPKAIREHAPGWQSVRHWGWEEWSRAIAAYLGYAAFADHCMKIVLDALEASGRAENTIVIATGDHGEMMGAHNLYQKGVLYEKSVALACVVRDPGLTPGRRDQLISHVDFAPTVLEMLDMPPLTEAQGKSRAPILKDASTSGPEYQFIEFNGYIEGGIHMRGAVSRRYKYVYCDGDKDMFFDIENDPDEMVNLIDSPKFQNVIQEHREALRQWMKQTGDFLKMK